MLSVLIDWAVKPFGLMFLLLLLCVGSSLLTRRRHGRTVALLIVTVTVFWIFSAPVIANALVFQIETWRKNPIFCAEPNYLKTIVVLGGGLDKYVASNSAYEILDQDSQLRVNRAIEVAAPDSHFYLLGGSNHERKPAMFMANLLIDRNIENERVHLETASLSTHENALALTKLLPPEEHPNITLVTSAIHIPRAASVFEFHGYQVCHVTADSRYSPAAPPVSYLPYLNSLNKTHAVYQELLATFVYKLRGYIE